MVKANVGLEEVFVYQINLDSATPNMELDEHFLKEWDESWDTIEKLTNQLNKMRDNKKQEELRLSTQILSSEVYKRNE